MNGTVRNRKEHSSDATPDLKETWNRRHTLKSGRQPLLCSYEELPAWYRESENEYIRHGYRPEMASARACLSSWTYLHNETFNIYSHLVAAVSFLMGLFLMDRLMVWNFPAASTMDRAVFAFFVSAGVGAFTLSSLYHTFICHSPHFSHFWLQLDFVGILCLTFGGFVSGIYVGFYCDPALQKLYWSMIFILSSLSSILVLHPRLQGRQYRTFRVTIFVSTGLSGLLPVLHAGLVYGFRRAWSSTGMPYYLLEGVLFILGATIYALRFPESFVAAKNRQPGRFDFYGSSHNIFHVLVVLATLVHLVGIWQAFAFQYRCRCDGMCSAAAVAGADVR